MVTAADLLLKCMFLTILTTSPLSSVDAHIQKGLVDWDKIPTTRILGIEETPHSWMLPAPSGPNWVELLKDTGITFDGGLCDPLSYSLPGGGCFGKSRVISPWKGRGQPWLPGPPPWIPGPGPSPGIPEPATILILGCGVFLVIVTRTGVQ